MNIKRAIRNIPPICRTIAGLLIIIGILIACKREPYVITFEDNQPSYYMAFLQEGQYHIEITYVGFEPGDRIWVYSNSLIDSQNQIGVTLAETVVPEYAGIVDITVTLSDGVYDINVVNDSKVGHFEQGKLQSARLQNRDNYFLAFLFFLLSFFVLLGGCRRYFERYSILFLLTGLGILASIPVFSDFLYSGDDITFHLARLEGIFQALRAGEFPVRVNMVQNKGYGNLSASMYPSLFLLPFAAMRFLRVSLMLCYKMLIVAVNIATAFISYYSLRKLCNSRKIGLWACILYTFSAYRLNNLYMRCAIGEALAMVFLPLVLWGTYELLWRDRKKWYILMLGMTCVIQSHVLSTEICAFFMAVELVIWLLTGAKKDAWGRVLEGIKTVVVTALLNAGFLIPFICFSMQDLQSFHMENMIGEFPVYFTQMFAMFMPATGGSVSPGSTRNEMALSVGFVLLAGSILFCMNQMRNRENDSETGKIGRRCFGYGVVGLLLASWLFPWDRLLEMEWFEKFSAPLQFPWRFFGVSSIFLALVSAIGIESTREKWHKYIEILMIGLTICSTGYCFDMICQQRETLGDKMEIESIDHSDSMYMYYISEQFETWHLRLSREEATIDCTDILKVSFSDYEKRGTKISVTTQNPENAEEVLVFPLCYYPGYVVRVDGEIVETKVYEMPIRLVACDLPEQTAHITISYEGLWFFRVGDAVTAVTAAGLIFAMLRRRKKAKVRA